MYHGGSCCRCGAAGPLVEISEFGKAVCEGCYPEFWRRRVEATIRRFRMIPRAARVAVAVSGGGDSGALLHALGLMRRRLNFSVLALHLDQGMGEYTEQCLATCREQAALAGVELHVGRVADFGVRVEAVQTWPVCAVCGAVRRAILPVLARERGVGVVCTGHTLDDHLMFMLKNILSGHPASPPPVQPAIHGYPSKAKPLIQIPDVAAKTYARLCGIPAMADPCPWFDPSTHRLKGVFELLEQCAPMGKQQFWQVMRKLMPRDGGTRGEAPCRVCGELTSLGTCPLCRLRGLQAAPPEG
jgi:tRNA-5-methyluridine54 2-sulfurtransferase